MAALLAAALYLAATGIAVGNPTLAVHLEFFRADPFPSDGFIEIQVGGGLGIWQTVARLDSGGGWDLAEIEEEPPADGRVKVRYALPAPTEEVLRRFVRLRGSLIEN